MIRSGRKNRSSEKILLAALVAEWGQKHCAVPATFAVEFVNADMPVEKVTKWLKSLKILNIYPHNKKEQLEGKSSRMIG